MITAFQGCLNFLTKMTKFLRRKKTKTIPESLVTVPKETQYPDGMEKGDKVGISIEGSKKLSVCVTPLLSLKTPPKCTNKRDYKGDTHDKTLNSSTKDTDVLKGNDDNLKRNLEKRNK